MLDITVIILTYNEELHIRRCLEGIAPVAKKVYIVDSPSTDKTVEIVQEVQEVQKVQGGADVEVVVHKYPGNQAEQFNWSIDNLKIDTEWVLRLDADEYLTPELIAEMEEKLPAMSKDVSAVVLPLGRAFMGRVLKHGIVNGISMIRLFRRGKARYEARVMDEHLQVLEGETVTFENKFVDDNRLPLSKFKEKHRNYAKREAAIQLLGSLSTDNIDKNQKNPLEESKADASSANEGVTTCESKLLQTNSPSSSVSLDEPNDSSRVKDTASLKYNGNGQLAAVVQAKRAQKDKYAKMPLFLRAVAYFCYRYFFKLGFLDGKEGFYWDFYQGLWYRWLVDKNILKCKKACGDDKEKIKEYIRKSWNISI